MASSSGCGFSLIRFWEEERGLIECGGRTDGADLFIDRVGLPTRHFHDPFWEDLLTFPGSDSS